jgi:hypothetical protein
MQEPVPGQSVEERDLALIGGRRFCVYRADPPPGESAGDDLFNATFAELDARYQSDRSGPIGVAVPVSDLELMRRRPGAVWPETELIYAGTSPEGTQLRIRYFYDATVGPGLPNSPSIAESEAEDYSLSPGYRLAPLAETDAVTPDDVLEFWTREQAMPDPGEAQRRVHEVLIVALDPTDRLAAVSTVYLQRNPQLGLDLWAFRTFVASEHRMGHLAIRLLWATRDHLRERYVSGEDARAPGMLVEVENDFLQVYYNRAYSVISDFNFIGENERGDHVRVHYFPGAQAPIPQ